MGVTTTATALLLTISVTSKTLHNHHNTPRWNSSSWYDLWLDQ